MNIYISLNINHLQRIVLEFFDIYLKNTLVFATLFHRKFSSFFLLEWCCHLSGMSWSFKWNEVLI